MPILGRERRLGALMLCTAGIVFLAGCNRSAAPDERLPALQTVAGLPEILVLKSASCMCCAAWIDHLRLAGFAVRIHNVEDMTHVKDTLSVPASERSCHTALVDGYFVEGHVPAQDIKRLLAERPVGLGLALPGMPAGSPGMEAMGSSTHDTGEPYIVDFVAGDGSIVPYRMHSVPAND